MSPGRRGVRPWRELARRAAVLAVAVGCAPSAEDLPPRKVEPIPDLSPRARCPAPTEGTLRTGSIVLRAEDAAALASGVTVITGDLTLGPASDTTVLRDLVEVYGSVRIDGAERLRDLSVFPCLRSIGGDLVVVDARRFTTTTGPYDLREIGGDLELTDLPYLVSLEGLHHVTRIGGSVRLTGTSGVVHLRGLRGLEEVVGNVELTYVRNLTSLRGLEALQRIGGTLSAVHADDLHDLSGVEALKQAWGVRLEANSALASVDGLDHLDTAAFVDISDNISLHDLDGLGGLRVVTGDVEVRDNPVLVDVAGLANLEEVGAVRLVDNASLCGGALRAITRALQWDVEVTPSTRCSDPTPGRFDVQMDGEAGPFLVGDTVELSAAATLDRDPTEALFRWTMDVPTGGAATLDPLDTAQTTFAPSAPGVYGVWLDAIDRYGRRAQDHAFVVVTR